MNRKNSGQGLAEYAIILGLVAVVVIAVMHFTGNYMQSGLTNGERGLLKESNAFRRISTYIGQASRDQGCEDSKELRSDLRNLMKGGSPTDNSGCNNGDSSLTKIKIIATGCMTIIRAIANEIAQKHGNDAARFIFEKMPNVIEYLVH
jgi:Flp pilus assembly pilin Flp